MDDSVEGWGACLGGQVILILRDRWVGRRGRRGLLLDTKPASRRCTRRHYAHVASYCLHENTRWRLDDSRNTVEGGSRCVEE